MKQPKFDAMDAGQTGTSGPVECLGMTFPDDAARRAYFMERLREKLKDPEFRKIEGFPIGEDDAILAMSDPPYYTACPNPWLAEFVKCYGKPYDPKGRYHREPFAADVTDGKNHPIYNAHSYHTKVPHRAIMRYILHYTEPGEVVFDGFCGTGMAGVAAQLCADRTEVRALGYQVNDEGIVSDEQGRPISRLGARRSVLVDLAPMATLISHCYTNPAAASGVEAKGLSLVRQVEVNVGWVYATLHRVSGEQVCAAVDMLSRTASDDLVSLPQSLARIGAVVGRINYVVWSDVFICPECSHDVLFWEAAVDLAGGAVRDTPRCPHCTASLTKRAMERAWTATLDAFSGTQVRMARRLPVLINYAAQVPGKATPSRFEKAPDAFDLALVRRIEELPLPPNAPTSRMIPGDESRRNDRIGMTHAHHFYTSRSLRVMSALFAGASGSQLLKCCLLGGNTVGMRTARFLPNRWINKDTGPMKPHTAGTLYVPSLSGEQSWINIAESRLRAAQRARESTPFVPGSTCVATQSATSLPAPSDSVDYLFIDPPFGANLSYSELNFVSESWLRVTTNQGPEAIESQTQGKGIREYRGLMVASFREAFRLLKPGRWMTVIFSNTRASVWNCIQSALQEVGFVIANVSAMDKQQRSFKAVTTPTAVKQDLVISAYKPSGQLELDFERRGPTEDGVWDFVREHLANLPVVKARGGQLEVITERDPRILYDRTVAFYVRHGVPVPLSSGEFQEGLAARFPERDGMVFLPEQAAEYDRKRLQMQSAGQMTLFVEDERSAVDWLRGFLKARPSKTQDITPAFLEKLNESWKKWETRPELRTLLEQYFLCFSGEGDVPDQIGQYFRDDYPDLRGLPVGHPLLREKAKDRWYVPDSRKVADVERLREKRLLDEFWGYAPPGYNVEAAKRRRAGEPPLLPGMEMPLPKLPRGKRLKEVRIEAVRVGFHHCFRITDYATIIAVSRYIPEDVVQNDDQLQMMVDAAMMRAGVEE